LGGVFGVGEQGLVARKVLPPFQTGRHRIDATSCVAVNHIVRHIPTLLGTARQRIAHDLYVAPAQRLLDDRRTTRPDLGTDLYIVRRKRCLKGWSSARHDCYLASTTGAQYSADKMWSACGAFPMKVSQPERLSLIAGGRRRNGRAREIQAGECERRCSVYC